MIERRNSYYYFVYKVISKVSYKYIRIVIKVLNIVSKMIFKLELKSRINSYFE